MDIHKDGCRAYGCNCCNSRYSCGDTVMTSSPTPTPTDRSAISRVRTIGYTNRLLCAYILGKLFFQASDLITKDELRSTHHLQQNLQALL